MAPCRKDDVVLSELCTSFLLLGNELSRTWWHKTAHIYDLTSSVGSLGIVSQRFRSGSHRAAVKVSSGLYSHLELTSVAISGVQGLVWLLAVFSSFQL